MTSATIKVLLSHLLRVSLDTGCRLQNHLFQGVQLLPFLLEMNITYWNNLSNHAFFFSNRSASLANTCEISNSSGTSDMVHTFTQ